MKPKWIEPWLPDRLRTVARALALGLFLSSTSGCYERVIAAEGIGTEGYDEHEPNLKENPGPVEEFIFGPTETKE